MPFKQDGRIDGIRLLHLIDQDVGERGRVGCRTSGPLRRRATPMVLAPPPPSNRAMMPMRPTIDIRPNVGLNMLNWGDGDNPSQNPGKSNTNKNQGGGTKLTSLVSSGQAKDPAKKKPDPSKYAPKISQMAETLVGPAASTRTRLQVVETQGTGASSTGPIQKMFNASKEKEKDKEKDKEYKSKN